MTFRKMDDTFKIFVHRLKEGREEIIDESLLPGFLNLEEPELHFEAPIILHGVANLADGTFVVTLSAKTSVFMPCSICNQMVPIKIIVPTFCYTQPLSSIKGGVFDYREILREAILLEIPYTAECNEGDCPERANLAKYLPSKQ